MGKYNINNEYNLLNANLYKYSKDLARLQSSGKKNIYSENMERFYNKKIKNIKKLLKYE